LNIEHRTSNIEGRRVSSACVLLGAALVVCAFSFDVGRSMFDVRCSFGASAFVTVVGHASESALGRSLAALDNDQAVRSGRDALSRGWVWPNHPWYDRAADDAKLIPLPKPKQQTSWNFTWLSDFWEWLSAPFRFSLFGWNVAFSLGQILLIVLLVIALVVLVRYLSKLYREKTKHHEASQGEEGESELSDVDRIEALPVPVLRRNGDLLAAAQEHYQRGEYREAIIALFAYLLLELDKQQVIRLAKGKTNRQYLREIGPREALRLLYAATMEQFEAVFFGDHDLRREAFEACVAQVQQLRESRAAERA
jgi:hypothetical protein